MAAFSPSMRVRRCRAGGRPSCQSTRGVPSDNMAVVWILLALLPVLGGAERFSCRGRILGAYYADAKSGCKAFHVCVRVAGGGIRDFRFFCPPGTLFHQEAQTCTDWGDDDPLACPADLYDGQFDLYKIGSGFDTKKVSSPGNRDEESEFALQRAESGDRRLNNGPASDLRAAHSSDFFSGQRDRGRDDAPSPTSQRQSFRRGPTTRSPPTTLYQPTTNTSPQPSNPPHYEQKRKLVRKRPIYTKSTNYPQETKSTAQPNYPQQFLQKQSYSQSPAPQTKSTAQQNYQQSTPQQQQSYQKPPTLPQNYQNQPSSQQNFQSPPQQSYQQQVNPKPTQQQNLVSQQVNKQSNQQPLPQQNFNQRPNTQNRVNPTPSPPAVVPPQYKDEYVEVSRVTPKKSRYYASPTTPQFSQSTAKPNYNKKDGLVELFNYDSQSTPGINTQKDRFKVKNSFSVADIALQREQDFARTNVKIQPNGASRASPTTLDYNTASSRNYPSTTPAYKNFNSVSYESDKTFGFSSSKQVFYNPSTTASTNNAYTTQRSNPPANLNTVAYNTNNGFNNIQSANYVGGEDSEDDGQYRPPHGEDDGQYRPELYERERDRDRELLSGAHSLNIAASGNRLPEDQKQNKNRFQNQKTVVSTAAPRPFRPAPTQASSSSATRFPEFTYPTTYRAPASSKVTFDQVQTYTTTSRPEAPAPPQVTYSAPPRPTQAPTSAPSRPTAAPTTKPPPPRPPQTSFNQPANNKEDASYDYAYYDSDPGFSEYDQIQEFGKTKKA